MHMNIHFLEFQQSKAWDFPSGPLVKTSPSNARGAGSMPGWGPKTPHASGSKKPKYKIEALL